MLILKLALILVLSISVVFFSIFIVKGIKAKMEKVENSYSKDLQKHSFFFIVSIVVLIERLSSIV